MIPQIMKFYITPRVVNKLRNFLQERDYFYTENKFKLIHLRIGPFKGNKSLKVKFSSLVKKNILFPNAITSFALDPETHQYFYDMEFNSDQCFNYDFSLDCSGFKFKFKCWINLWFSTIGNISNHIMKNVLSNDIQDAKKDNSEDINNSKNIRKSKKMLTESFRMNQSQIKNFSDMMKKMEELERKNDIENDKACRLNLVAEQRNDSKELLIDKSNNMGNVFNFNDEEYRDDIQEESISTEKIHEVKMNQDIDISGIELIEIKKEKENNRRIKKTSVGRLVSIFKEDKDLIQFIHGVNETSEEFGMPQYDISDQKIILGKKKLDKFKDAFGTTDDDFRVEYTYCLIQGE